MALQGNGPALINNGSYTLKPIVEDIPLSESNEVEIRITCVELWGPCVQEFVLGSLLPMSDVLD